MKSKKNNAQKTSMESNGIILTKDISKFLRKERKKIKYHLRHVVKDLEIDETTLKQYELGSVKLIPTHIYQKLIGFYENLHANLLSEQDNNFKNDNINSKVRLREFSKRILFPEEMALFFKNGREKMNISLKELSLKVGISLVTLRDYEGRVCKKISEKNYIKLINFFSENNNNLAENTKENIEAIISSEKDNKNIENKSPDAIISERMKLTPKMADFLKNRREKIKFSREAVQKEIGINSGVLARYENKKVKTIPKKIFEKLMALYKYISKNKIISLPTGHISFTKEMGNILKEKREKSLFSCKEVSENVKIGEILLRKYELNKINSISEKNYENLINFYNKVEENKLQPKYLSNRIILNETISNSLKKHREKIMFTVEEVSSKTNISKAIIHKSENLDIKSISKEHYENLLSFYTDAEEKGLKSNFLDKRIYLTFELRDFLKKERAKTKYSYKEIAQLIDINPSSLSNYEIGTLHTIPKDIYQKLLSLYEDFSNGKLESKSVEDRIILSKKTALALKKERMKTKHSIMSIVRKTGVSKTIIFKVENLTAKSISRKNYDLLSNTYKEILSNKIEPKFPHGRISLTKEIALSLRKYRQKLNLSTQKVADLTGLKRTTIVNYELKKARTVKEEELNKLICFYKNHKLDDKKTSTPSRERIILTKKIALSFKKKREENNISFTKIASDLGIAYNIYRNYELMKVKTISKDIYFKIMGFYHSIDDIKDYKKN